MERGFRIWSVEVRMLHAPTRGMMQAIGFHDHGQAVKGGFKLLFAMALEVQEQCCSYEPLSKLL